MAKKASSDGPISFKLPEPEFRAALEAEALREGISIHLAARRLVLRGLTEDWKQELLDQIGGVQSEQRKLRQDIATLFQPVLAHLLNKDRKTIETWIRERLAP